MRFYFRSRHFGASVPWWALPLVVWVYAIYAVIKLTAWTIWAGSMLTIWLIRNAPAAWRSLQFLSGYVYGKCEALNRGRLGYQPRHRA